MLANQPLTPTEDDLALLNRRDITDPQIRHRITVERAIVRYMATSLMRQGYTLRLNDGEEWSTPKDASAEQIMEALQATDEETLHVFTMQDGQRKHAGHVALVYGNDGWDVISDHTTSLTNALTATTGYAKMFEEA